jgi:8-oxo-dGTP pyrophosphatase MutT (NUDIX family)
MTGSDTTARRAARVILLDAASRVLLLHGHDPARPEHRYWFTVGGGLDPGESMARAAARELAEETGLRIDPGGLGAPVWHDTTEFGFDGHRYRQEQDFFLVRVESWEVDVTGFNAVERASVDGYRWWSVAELRATTERVYPPDLSDLVERILQESPC